MEIQSEKFPLVKLERKFMELSGPLEDITWDSGTSWYFIKSCYADTIQRDLLRALNVAGIYVGRWKTVFDNLYNGVDAWGVVNQNWFENKKVPTWHELFALVVTADNGNIQYPIPNPAGLTPFGYTQHQYLTDLKEYWTDLAPEYYRPWSLPSSRVGYDTVVVDTINQLSQETQADIEQLIQSAKLLLHLVHRGDADDNH